MSLKAYKSGSAFPEPKKDTIRIYSSRLCPYAERALLVLRHKNIPYETINIDLKDKPEWFTSRTPTGTVPVFEYNGTIIIESTAVSEYIDDVFPGEKLQPSDPLRKAQDRVLLEQFGKLTTPYYGILFNNSDTEEKKAEVAQKINQVLKILQFYETELEKRDTPYFGGKSPAMIDLFMWPHFERLPAVTKTDSRVDIANFSKLAGWCKAMIEVPSVKDIMFDADWHYEVLKMYRTGKASEAPNYGLED